MRHRLGAGNLTGIVTKADKTLVPDVFYVNGAPFPIPTGDAIDDFIPTRSCRRSGGLQRNVAGPAAVQPEQHDNPTCGVVVIWMRGRPDADQLTRG